MDELPLWHGRQGPGSRSNSGCSSECQHTCPEQKHSRHSCPRSPLPAPPPALRPRCLSVSACFLSRRVPRSLSPTISCPGQHIPLFPHNRSLLPPPHLTAGCCRSPLLPSHYPSPLPPPCLSFLRWDPHTSSGKHSKAWERGMVKLASLHSFGVLKEAMFAPICHVGQLAKHQWGDGDLECDPRGSIPAPDLPSAPKHCWQC